ncbi:MAG: glucoamylase family protein [Ginsengibacter sp.]
MAFSQKENKTKEIFKILPGVIAALKKNLIEPVFGDNLTEDNNDEKLPLRSELFTEEQLERHAIALAEKHTLLSKNPSENLLKRLAENEKILLEVHENLTEAVKSNTRIVPAAEWLLDNFYLIEEQIYTAKKHLPKGYSRELPQLLKGASAGLPRIYDIAVEIISHSDGHVNLYSLSHFITSYQTINFLQLGELWAVPIMLRLALLENLRRLAIQISIDIANKTLAAHWAEEMTETIENNPKNLVLVIADMARSKPPMESSFVAELSRRLQEKGSALTLAINWMEQHLTEEGLSSTVMIQSESQKQAADQVSISNSISSLRFLSTTDWGEFVEKNSTVEQTLLQDSVYSKMDFYTRDQYRHAIERIAKRSILSQQEVAALAIDYTKKNAGDSIYEKKNHVGYYLTGKGVYAIEKAAKMHTGPIMRCRRFANKIPLVVYSGSIIILTAFISWGLISKANTEGFTNWMLLAFGVILFLATSQLATSIINWLTTLFTNPCLLPRMDFSKGIPDEYRTMVVIPTMLTNSAAIADIMEGLEVRFLANRDANLSFALLTDYKDATQETLDEDEPLVQFVKNKIIALNKKYERQSNDTFFLFHRPRRWNKYDKIWMGYERKRGKLGELNALIQGNGKDFFSLIVGEESLYTSVKYIITLDTDTQLPRDVAWKMAATMAHPLNHPVYNTKKKRVTEGYTILQPRVSNSLPLAGSSLYAKTHGNEPGTDPYTRATSDVYQDLFNEGSFIGKGIYDIAAFETSLKNRFPENRILSHDLLEGAYSRAGLITDVQLYEEYPSDYVTDIQRRHRWVRGDWQIARWITPFVTGFDKKLHKNPLSLLSIWKIADNLRRSLTPISFLLIFLAGWTLLSHPAFWSIVVLGIIILPVILHFIWQVFKKPPDVLFIQHLIYTTRSLKDNLLQHIIDFICLPYEAYVNAHAILLTLWRIFISGKNLLQWNPYSSYQRDKKTIANTYLKILFAPLLSVVTLIYVYGYFPAALIIALPFLLGWLAAPLIAWYISRPVNEYKIELSSAKNLYLRKLARKIWAFFETFAGSEDNWLPPDNYQEHPVERIAHRTSPTNIGLSLLANLTARDFGYITNNVFIERTDNTINTLTRLKKYRGHLYNWYDTISLNPLTPEYISTVDSGNFVGHILTLKQALFAIPDEKIITAKSFEGISDTVDILIEKTEDASALKRFKQQLENTFLSKLDSLQSIKIYLDELDISFREILIDLDLNPENEDDWWAEKITMQLNDIKREMSIFFPWLSLASVPQKFEHLFSYLPDSPTLNQGAKIEESLLQKIISCYYPENSATENEWLNSFRACITEAARHAKEMMLKIRQIATKCTELSTVEYDFLYDKTQHLLTIGYNADEHRRDNSFYDLLASECRLTTFTAIAQGKLPQQSWFALGRQLTNQGATPILLSWSGSMFEYLMPSLVMPAYENTLLDQTNKAIVQKQIDYGKKRGVPWGISESGYNLLDANLNYQYRAFGIPGIGFKRGLGEDLVIAPYATVMALMVAPEQAYDNLVRLKEAGFEGKYGFYEAIDYTPSRLPRRTSHAVIRSFMAHHQGMSFLSISFLLLNKPMQRRFETDLQMRSALLLLQEKIPRLTTFYSPTIHESDINVSPAGVESMRVIDTPQTTIPEVQLLSNGRYHVMLTNAGGGYSRWKNIALTRWREDSTCDNYGTFCYIRDLDNNIAWSTAFQPTLKQGDNYEAVFSQGRAEFRRRDSVIETHTEIVVSPEDDIELRRVHLINRSRKRRSLEITSYAEVVLAVPIADEVHPAFSNLFVQTEINEHRHAIICTRRPRSEDEQNPWMFHLMKVHNAEIQHISYETARDKFIGRGNTINNPLVINQADGLSGSSGSVLDPVVSIQYRIFLEPYQSATIDMIFGIAETKELCNNLVEKYQDRNLTNRGLELAWTHSQVILRQINAVEADAQLYNRLAGSIIYSNPSLRTDSTTIIKNQRGQSALWSHGISGDLPIILLLIEDMANVELVKQMVQAHAYWHLKGLLTDLVIWNDDHGGYRQVLQDRIHGLVAPGISGNLKDQPGGIFIRSADQITNEDRILFQTVAHVVISDSLGSLEEQINRATKLKSSIPLFTPTKFYPSIDKSIPVDSLIRELQFYNGIGGFSKDGKEYIIITSPGKQTPAPWINVLGNPQFGTIVSESGSSYTWVENAHEIRLTPWNNDPITDLKGEAFYLRDEESGKFWSPTPLPCPGKSAYITKHGFGYTTFLHTEDGIESEMNVYTDIEAPLKFIILKIKNNSGRSRRISATGYVEWVLGDIRSKSLMHTITEMDRPSGAVLARNAYSAEFVNRVAFFDTDDVVRTFTTDRAEFIGRNGTLNSPDAMNRVRLSGKRGAALDPCAAIQVVIDLAEEEERKIIFRLGTGKNMEEALALIKRFEGSMAAEDALREVQKFWQSTLGTIQIETPDVATNILANGWLNYQTLSCRIWARTGFYQSGGAVGFRDQLQDVLSLVHSKPLLLKEQILLCASRQFVEGDVQHWWHPPKGRGVRTTCSDDYLWLPFVTSRYIEVTGDKDILDESIHFLEGRLLNAGEESYYDLPIMSDKMATLYEHCVKAIEHGLRFGEHGLPFIGSGDWNDGMDKVGNYGRGESVWLAFFLYDILMHFTETAALKNDKVFEEKCRLSADALKANINKNAWDGEWYRRAYFDDGTPLGSKENEECKIDSIAQSWSVLSKAGDMERSLTAMQSAGKFLVRKEDGMIQLFDPPFDKSAMNPGYIKGYVPGVRENGGQYTHAAIWLVMAFAALKDRERTWDLLKMINPLNRSSDAAKIATYKVEPYVIAADVYAEPNNKGRGGWTWYTGSAGWMYQLIIGSFIGLKRKNNTLHFTPCIPEGWDLLKISYRYMDTMYKIELKKVHENELTRVIVDGKQEINTFLTLVNDGTEHKVEFFI